MQDKKACARTLNSESHTHNEPSLAGDQASPARSSVSTANSCGGANHLVSCDQTYILGLLVNKARRLNGAPLKTGIPISAIKMV
jgi:hypothetical protein